jgi:hypothetical protein
MTRARFCGCFVLVLAAGCDRKAADAQHNGKFVEVVARGSHTCALDTDGHARCWGGDNRVGAQWRTTPTDRFATIATGHRFACGIRKDDGAVSCWGDCVGQTCSAPAGRFARLALAAGGGCALADDGRATCWGQANPEFQELPPDLDSAPLRELEFGYFFASAILPDGTLRVWSTNPPNEYTKPILDGVPSGAFRRITSNTTTACALKDADGGAVCWSNKSAADAPSVATLPVLDVALHNTAGCMIVRSDIAQPRGWISCVGIDGKPSGREFVRVAVGRAHGCGLDSRGGLTCWGDDKFGQSSGRAPNRWMP